LLFDSAAKLRKKREKRTKTYDKLKKGNNYLNNPAPAIVINENNRENLHILKLD